MRVLADENVPEPAVAALRAHGYDVVWMHEVAAGTPDLEVLARAQREQRVLVTLDKDFGELAFRHGAAAQCGVVLVRLTAISPDVVACRPCRAGDASRLDRHLCRRRRRAATCQVDLDGSVCRRVTGQHRLTYVKNAGDMSNAIEIYPVVVELKRLPL